MAIASTQPLSSVTRGYLKAVPTWVWIFLLALTAYGLATLGTRTYWNAHTHLAWAILNRSITLSAPNGSSELISDIAGRN